jgi:hypothetical protein
MRLYGPMGLRVCLFVVVAKCMRHGRNLLGTGWLPQAGNKV